MPAKNTFCTDLLTKAEQTPLMNKLLCLVLQKIAQAPLT